MLVEPARGQEENDEDQDCKSAVLNLPPGFSFDQLNYVGWQQCIVEYEYQDVIDSEKFTPWATSEAWACGMFPSGTIFPPPPPIRQWSKQWNWCLDIGGNASVQPKLQLGGSLLELVEAQISTGYEIGIEGNIKHCETTTYTVSYCPLQMQCFDTHARVKFIEGSIQGIAREIETRFYWQPKNPPDAMVIVVDCGVKSAEGIAVARKSDTVQYAPKTPECPVYPGEPIGNPDPWEGKRMMPCKPNGVPGCHEIVGQPTCGQYGGN
ncbi:MAG: hypothetical protein HBSAPP03_16010 [Phycisphaerae bacterium]|nr:MAG: hypothetical protein HBSAPP03_16010 [Phycisphaerae bacterium]